MDVESQQTLDEAVDRAVAKFGGVATVTIAQLLTGLHQILDEYHIEIHFVKK